MKVGFVVQRFGPGVEGGAERHCLEFARRVARDHDVEILTSTALHMGQWHRNHFPVGKDTYEGLSVRRFPVIDRRGPRSAIYTLLRKRLPRPGRRLAEQHAWLEAQGPFCPQLLDTLTRERESFDAFVFFTYLYHPTAMGLLRVADRALLVPTAHDEPPFHQEVFRPLFLAPRGILYNTVEERELVEARFDNGHVPSWIAGFGIDPPPVGERAPDPEFEDIVYLGRIDPHKVFDLIPFFERYAKGRPKVRLVLMGKSYMDLPNHPQIVATGFVDEEEKWRRLRNARVFVMPSEFESLSIVLLESWSVGVPALVNGRCAVLAGHVERSQAGLTYTDYDEFARGLDQLLDAPVTPSPIGERGKAYVANHYGWDAVMATVSAALKVASKQ